MNLENELKKVRQEAANYRTQLAQYKKAFEGLDEDSIQWVLESVGLIQQNPNQAGLRFANLAYANLGEDAFKTFAQNLYGDFTTVTTPTTQVKDMAMDDAQFQQWAQMFEQKMMSAIDNMKTELNNRFVENDRQREFDRISEAIRSLGYDPDSWQGKMLLDVAANEAQGNEPIARLRHADTLVRERIGSAAPAVPGAPAQDSATPGTGEGGGVTALSLPEQQYQVVGGVRIPVTPEPAVSNGEPVEVPPTGGLVGGGGVPNGAAEEPNSFSDADSAMMALLQGSAG